MPHALPRTAATLLLAVLLAVLLALLLGPALDDPAAARPDGTPVLAHRGPAVYYVYAPGTGPGFDDQYVYPALLARGGTAHDVVVTVDTGATVGALEWSDDGGGCPRQGAVFTCDLGTVEGLVDLGPLKGRAAEGSAPGDGGLVTFHATSSDAAPLDWTMRATVGRPELTVQRVAPPAHLAPGASFDVPVTVRNDGNVAAEGFRVEVDAPEDVGLAPVGGPACRWRRAFDEPDAASVRCTFHRTLAPGDAVRLDRLFRATARPTLLYGDLGVVAYPIGGDLDTEAVGGGGRPSPPPRMRLGPVRDPVPGTFVPGLTLRLRADSAADLAAFGDTARGRVGSVVRVVVGTRNLGPGVLDVTATGASAYSLVFEPPPGTTVVGNPYPGEDDPWTCAPGRRGAATYTCPPYSERLELRRAERFVFDLRIDAHVPHATGRVLVVPARGRRSAHDTDAANDSADVVVTSHGTAPSPSPSPSPAPNARPGPPPGHRGREVGVAIGVLVLAGLGATGLVLRRRARARTGT